MATGAGERHRVYAAQFAALVDHVSDWEAPSPVVGWTAHSVIDHLTTWFPAFVHAGSPYGWTRRTSATDAPALAWAEQSNAVQLILGDPAQADSSFHHPQLPSCTLGEAVDRFYTPDVFMHSWDLARATGQEFELDPGFAEELLRGMESMEEVMRSSGQYGPRVPVPDSAPVQDRLLGFIGRDPHWSP
ncbi:TIGR03086 family metal-binding protein [Nocardioides gilvus]|uniref:TIGR03086 family metal-binding protein n=1 Tax=Nocardioides gilvus TaxID=1735589 RepID=UPI000D740768|nr:TIGR03086 family metal-binding protein [Nocardioides gilvus]